MRTEAISRHTPYAAWVEGTPGRWVPCSAPVGRLFQNDQPPILIRRSVRLQPDPSSSHSGNPYERAFLQACTLVSLTSPTQRNPPETAKDRACDRRRTG